MSIHSSFVPHLCTQSRHDRTDGRSHVITCRCFILFHTSTITSKSVPNTGLVCLIVSCSFPGSSLSSTASVLRRPALWYTSLSILDPVRRHWISSIWPRDKVDFTMTELQDAPKMFLFFSVTQKPTTTHVYRLNCSYWFFCPTHLQDICSVAWHLLCGYYKHFWYWCSFLQSTGPLGSVNNNNPHYSTILASLHTDNSSHGKIWK